MNSTHIISQDVFDKIRSRFTNLEMGDEEGNTTSDPKAARFFDFDFVVENNNLGRVSISINETGALKLFYSQGILEETDDFVHQLWYDFLREMRMFAKRRLLRFDTRDITKSNLNKDDFQYLANKDGNKEPEMNESIKFEGSKKTSYRVLEKTKIIAKHKESIEKEGAGKRTQKGNIKALYIENAEGERFKYPFIHIAGAKAMQRHVANGGRPYDDKGNAIVRMSEQIAQLSQFKRQVGHDGMNQSVNEIAERANAKLESLRRQVEGLGGQQYYQKWSEAFVPNVGVDGLDQATMEDYKSKFTVSSFKEDLAQFFPLIHSIMQEAGTVDLEDYVSETNEDFCDACDQPVSKCKCDDVKESYFTKFTQWADAVTEGRVEPDTLMSLKDLLDAGLTLDVDGTSAIDALQGIGIHDDELESALTQLAQVNPKADPKDTILAWLSKTDPEAAKEFGYNGAVQDEEILGALAGGAIGALAGGPLGALSGAAAGDQLTDPDEDEAEEDSSEGEEVPTKTNPRAIAELVYSMYDPIAKKFPKGETGVVIHVGKEMGPEAGKLAEQLVAHLSSRINGKQDEGAAVDAFMAGKSPAMANTAAHYDQDRESGKSDEFESIMKLAGLAK